MDPAQNQPASGGPAQGGTGANTTSGSGGDMLDKGVNYAEKESGHQESPATTEKVCPGIGC
jgi:hypothetical protein